MGYVYMSVPNDSWYYTYADVNDYDNSVLIYTYADGSRDVVGGFHSSPTGDYNEYISCTQVYFDANYYFGNIFS